MSKGGQGCPPRHVRGHNQVTQGTRPNGSHGLLPQKVALILCLLGEVGSRPSLGDRAQELFMSCYVVGDAHTFGETSSLGSTLGQMLRIPK